VRFGTYEREPRSKMHFTFLAPNLIIQASTELQFQPMRDLDETPNPLLLSCEIHGLC
jgi:hypothetical protein